MAQVLSDGTIRHEDNCLADLENQHNKNKVFKVNASSLSDREVLKLAECHKDWPKTHAVLTDYVKMRRRPALSAEDLEELVKVACNHAPDGCNGGLAHGSMCCLARTNCRYHAYWKALEELRVEKICEGR